MTNYEKKEEKAINEVLKTIEKLDSSLGELDNLEQDTKKHDLATWYYEKKAVHEIKKILNSIDKYDKYDEKDIEKTEIAFEKKLSE